MSDHTDPATGTDGLPALSGMAQELTREVAALRHDMKRIPALETRTAIIGAVGLVVVLLAFGFGFLAWNAREAANEATTRAECQARVNNALIATLDERSESSKQARQKDRESMDALLTSLLTTTNRTDSRDALLEFKHRNAATEQSRSTAPYPTTKC